MGVLQGRVLSLTKQYTTQVRHEGLNEKYNCRTETTDPDYHTDFMYSTHAFYKRFPSHDYFHAATYMRHYSVRLAPSKVGVDR